MGKIHKGRGQPSASGGLRKAVRDRGEGGFHRKGPWGRGVNGRLQSADKGEGVEKNTYRQNLKGKEKIREALEIPNRNILGAIRDGAKDGEGGGAALLLKEIKDGIRGGREKIRFSTLTLKKDQTLQAS